VVSPNAMNNARDTFGFTEMDGMLYAIGGRQWGTVVGPDQDTVESAQILPDGSVGPWMMNHGRLPAGLGFASAEAVGDHIYVVDHWSAYYAEKLDSMLWEGDVEYNDEAVMSFEALLAGPFPLVGPFPSEELVNTAEIAYGTSILYRDASFALDKDWTKEIWISGEGPFGPEDSPFDSVMPNDSITIVDMVQVGYQSNVTLTLTEEWNENLEMTDYALQVLPGGTLFLPGSALLPGLEVVTDTGMIALEVTDMPWEWTYVLTKTYEATGGTLKLGDVGYITETLWVEDASPQLDDVVLEFSPWTQYAYLPLVMRNATGTLLLGW
jgi:hypothetical protein